MKKFIITENEKQDILGLYLNESLGGGNDMSSMDRVNKKFPGGINIPTTITSSGTNTFANGVDTINPKNPNIVKIVNTIGDYLKNVPYTEMVTVVVNGGASRVGSSGGYNNQALAQRRRDNMIKFLREKFQTKQLNLVPGSAKVGKATQMNSPEAQKEQFVSVTFSSSGNVSGQIKGEKGDNTNTATQDIYRDKVGGTDWDPTVKEFTKVCVTIPSGLVGEYKKKVAEFRSEYKMGNLDFKYTTTKIK